MARSKDLASAPGNNTRRAEISSPGRLVSDGFMFFCYLLHLEAVGVVAGFKNFLDSPYCSGRANPENKVISADIQRLKLFRPLWKLSFEIRFRDCVVPSLGRFCNGERALSKANMCAPQRYFGRRSKACAPWRSSRFMSTKVPSCASAI